MACFFAVCLYMRTQPLAIPLRLELIPSGNRFGQSTQERAERDKRNGAQPWQSGLQIQRKRSHRATIDEREYKRKREQRRITMIKWGLIAMCLFAAVNWYILPTFPVTHQYISPMTIWGALGASALLVLVGMVFAGKK